MKKIVMIESQEFFADVKIGAHHYAERFAENGYEVLWISPAFSPIHKFNKAINIKERERLNSGCRVELKKNIYGYSPKVFIPFVGAKFFNSKLIGKIYLYTTFPSIKSILKKLDFYDADILWISNIKMYYIKNIISYKKLVHRVADDKRGFNNFFKTLEEFEVDLIKKSDVVFATSHKLIEKFEGERNDIKYLPNGVNMDDFSIEVYECPDDIKDIKDEKICIYIGAIAEWIDFDKVKKVINQMSDVNFVFIGPKHVDFSEIESNKNVRYLGKKPYKELIKYLKYSNVAWIPFVRNNLTDAINPVKLYEYLAAGVPTVTTRFKEIEYLDGPFEICDNENELICSLNKCINEFYDKKNLVSYANNNNWDKRFYDIIKECED